MVKLKLMAAVCENMGIGNNGNLPWRLKTEMDYFSKMTTKTNDPNKMNVVIMGRRTWDCIPEKYKPLPNRINFILSRSVRNYDEFVDQHVFGFTSLEDAISELSDPRFDRVESAWVIGGSDIYKDSLKSDHFYRLYLTKIAKKFECDTFFPHFPMDEFKEVRDPMVPSATQEEKGIQFTYHIYERKN